jgi:RNA polymerase sigma-70 factor (sigma-E family)
MTSRSGGFDEFFADHYAPVLRALALATGDRGLAEDATQEAFARAVRKWAKVREMERPVGWVYVVAMNVARRSLRRRGREQEVVAEATVVVAEHDVVGGVVARVVLRDAVRALPARQRAALVLRYLADLSVVDTASAMGCSPGTVKSSVHAALAALRIDLEDEDRDAN